MTQWIDEGRFITALQAALATFQHPFGAVTGPGRSGAIAAAYASYLTGRPFVPFGQPFPGPILVIDTATMSGRTLRKAVRKVEKTGSIAYGLQVYASPVDRYHFWYERPFVSPVDNSVDLAFPYPRYDWSPMATFFWWKWFPWSGPMPKPNGCASCAVWILWILIALALVRFFGWVLF
jgi:hypothetical protein